MPEEDSKAPQSDQESENSSDKNQGSKGKGKLLKFILIPVILIAQAAAAYFVVFKFLAPGEHSEEPEIKKEEHAEVGSFFEIKDLVINPAESLGRRYLVVEIGLETTLPELIHEATSKEIWIRDGILSSLNCKTADELLNVSQRDSLKLQILSQVNDKMTTGKFEKLYFTKYIMQ